MAQSPEINENTKLPFKFVLFVVIPMTMWLAGLSFKITIVESKIDKLETLIAQDREFREELIQRLTRIETLLDPSHRPRKSNR